MLRLTRVILTVEVFSPISAVVPIIKRKALLKLDALEDSRDFFCINEV